MKKSIVALLLSLLLSQVAFANEYESGVEKRVYGNSFFVQGSIGPSYHSIDINDEYRSYDGSFESSSLYLSLKLGLNVRNIFALYGGVDYSQGSGEWFNYKSDVDEEKASFFTLNINVGSVFYPFRSSELLDGTFFGFSLGFGGTDVNYKDEDGSDAGRIISDGCFFFKLNAGYTWNISPRWNVGLEAFVTFESYLDNDDGGYYGEDYHYVEGTTFGLNFTFMRR